MKRPTDSLDYDPRVLFTELQPQLSIQVADLRSKILVGDLRSEILVADLRSKI